MPDADVVTADGTARRHAALKQGVRIAGILVAVLAIALLVHTLAGEWDEVSTAIADANAGWLIGGLLCSAASMTGLGLLWWRCLRLFGSPVPPGSAVAWYFGGELGKYLPGGIWTVLGRGELARRSGRVTRSTGYVTTLISYGCMCVGAAAVCGALAPVFALDGRGGLGWAWAMLLLLPLGIAAVHPAIFGRLLGMARRATRDRVDLEPPPFPRMLALVAWAVPTWVLLGAASAMTTQALHYDQQPARVAFAAVAAWIIGFLAVPVPAGAGLREIVFVGLCGLDAAPATAVAVIARAMLIVVDGAGGVLGLWYSGRQVRATRAMADFEDQTTRASAEEDQ